MNIQARVRRVTEMKNEKNANRKDRDNDHLWYLIFS